MKNIEDIINYQAPIMTSYRPDNRKLFPNRRVKDVTSISAGATRINDKITLSHVEFMGYLENSVSNAYLTNYRNIFNQFPSVASAYGPDGITFFNYYTCIYFNSRKLPDETAEAYRAVSDGLKAYRLISEKIADKPTHLALYVPYSDWCVDRWTNCFLPANDALASLGISTEIFPFVPRKGEDILPFYPMNINRVQLQYLLDNKYVLILPDISGMQETDSELIETFARNGGVVIAFGPRIPYGDRFDREKFWGAEEVSKILKNKAFSSITTRRSPGTRTRINNVSRFDPVVSTSWNPPDLIRDVLDEALGFIETDRYFDIYGMNDNMDVATGEADGKYSVMVSNYNDNPVEVRIRLLIPDWQKKYNLVHLKSDSLSGKNVGIVSDQLRIKIDASDFVAVSLVPVY